MVSVTHCSVSILGKRVYLNVLEFNDDFFLLLASVMV